MRRPYDVSLPLLTLMHYVHLVHGCVFVKRIGMRVDSGIRRIKVLRFVLMYIAKYYVFSLWFPNGWISPYLFLMAASNSSLLGYHLALCWNNALPSTPLPETLGFHTLDDLFWACLFAPLSTLMAASSSSLLSSSSSIGLE